MTPRLHVRTRMPALIALGLALALPASAVAAGAGSGGSGLGGSGTGASTPTGTTTSGTASPGTTTSGSASTTGTPASSSVAATAAPAPSGPVSTAGDGITLSTNASGSYGSQLSFSGSAPAADGGDTLAIQRRVGSANWRTVAQGTVLTSGSFDASWNATASGRIAFRAVLEGPAGTAQADAVAPATATPALAVTIYRQARATIYGPGFYGHRTACGQTLTRATLGVASPTLRCGTKVSISYEGRAIVVPVIDRGPYANHAVLDLTSATATALGDTGTETVGAAAL